MITILLIRLGKFFKLLGSLPVWLCCLIFVYLSHNKNVILADVERNDSKRYKTIGGGKTLIYNYLYAEKCFRNIIYYRLNPIVAYFLNLFLSKNNNLHISTKIIGPGLLVAHGDATYINAKSIGNNVYINQCVTIGAKGSDTPVIGNNVRIATGSIVIGNITIGNNVTIGAGTVIVKSVPDNCTVVGNPARIVKLNGERINLEL